MIAQAVRNSTQEDSIMEDSKMPAGHQRRASTGGVTLSRMGSIPAGAMVSAVDDASPAYLVACRTQISKTRRANKASWPTPQKKVAASLVKKLSRPYDAAAKNELETIKDLPVEEQVGKMMEWAELVD